MLATSPAQAVALKAKLFRGFADPSRLAIVEVLRGRPMTVTEVVNATGLTQPNVSNHLSCLHDCGLVSRQQEGRFVHYQLSDHRVVSLLEVADALLSDMASGVYQCSSYNQTEEHRP